MNEELEILKIADYSERFEYEGAEAFLIVNKNIVDYPCMFGFVKMPDNFEVVRELFSRIEKRAMELGYKNIVGPLNYCTWLSYRWALNGYDKKYFPDCDNPRYYVDFIQKLGYEPLYTYRSASIKIDNPLFALGKAIVDKKEREGVVFKYFEGEEAYSIVRDIYDISCNAFSDAKLYSDIPYPLFERIYLSWTKKVNTQVYAAYIDGKMVGFVTGYENPYSGDFIGKTSAVLKDYQHQKIYQALLYLGCKLAIKQGHREMIYHFQCEQKKTFKRYDKEFESDEKKYAIFRKELK